MTKYSKPNRFLPFLIAGIAFFSVSCEKDTGDLGLSTLPEGDGLSVFNDNETLDNFTVAADFGSRTTKSYAGMVGSVIEKREDGTIDTLWASITIPFYLPEHNLEKTIDDAVSLNLFFSDNLYRHNTSRDKTLEFPLIIDELIGENEFVPIDTIIYKRNFKDSVSELTGNDTTFYSQFHAVLNAELFKKVLDASNAMIKDYPYKKDKKYTDADILEEREYCYSNLFKGIRIRPQYKGDYNLFRVSNASLKIKYYGNRDTAESFTFTPNNTSYSDRSYPDYQPYSNFYHSHNYSPDNGIFVQGAFGYKTILDFSSLAKWQDSSRFAFNNMYFQLTETREDTLHTLNMLTFEAIYPENRDTLSYFASYNSSIKGYRFQLEDIMNTLISDKIDINECTFQLDCWDNNTTANHALIDHSKGVTIKTTYSKY